MKIICIDNFDNEAVSDGLIATGLDQYMGKQIVVFLNEKFSGDYAPNYFKLVDDDYELFTFEP